MTKLNPGFLAEVHRYGSFDATACMNCGSCTALCPIGLDLLPRALFHAVALGLDRKVFDHIDTLFTCLLCKMCEENCPAGVHIAGNVRTLRHFVNKTAHNL